MEVVHDRDALCSVTSEQWKTKFRSRRADWSVSRGSSGVWDKKEWVAPWVDDEHVVSMGEGVHATPALASTQQRLGGRPQRQALWFIPHWFFQRFGHERCWCPRWLK